MSYRSRLRFIKPNDPSSAYGEALDSALCGLSCGLLSPRLKHQMLHLNVDRKLWWSLSG